MRKARYPQPTKDRIASPHTKPQGAWCAQCTTAPTGLQEEIARMDEIKDQLRTILEDHDAEFAGMVLEYAATLDRAGAPRSDADGPGMEGCLAPIVLHDTVTVARVFSRTPGLRQSGLLPCLGGDALFRRRGRPFPARRRYSCSSAPLFSTKILAQIRANVKEFVGGFLPRAPQFN